MVARRQAFPPVGTTGGEDALDITEGGSHPGLVDRDPILHSIPQRRSDHLGITAKGVDRGSLWPAALVLQRLRQIPVKERHPGFDPDLKQPIDKAPVEVETLLIYLTDTIGQDPRPGNRESIRGQTQFAHKSNVFLPSVIVVTGDVTGIPQTALIGKGVPDGLAFAVSSASLDLKS